MLFPKPKKVVSLFLSLFISFQVFSQSPKDRFLISIYSPPPANFMNDAQYRVMKEASVDVILNIGPGVLSNKEGNLKTLDMAKKHGLLVYVYDGRVYKSDDSIRALVNDYKYHPALAGYYVTDEPDSARLQWAIDTQKKVNKLDPARDAYVNHLPDWAVPNYENGFLKRWIEGVGQENLNYLAYDNYPYKRKQRQEKTYFNNLDIIRRVGLKYKVKTSSCLQSFGMSINNLEELRRPNADEIRMNVYSNLAYGVKNPVWYPYWSQASVGTVALYKCVIDTTGIKTDMFAPFSQMNAEMRQLGKTLIHLDATDVFHTGDSLWIGTSHPPVDFLIQSSDPHADVILTHFKDQKSTREYVMVVNRSYKKGGDLSFNLNPRFKKVKELSKKTGKEMKAPFDSKTNVISDHFLPGEGKLYAVYP